MEAANGPGVEPGNESQGTVEAYRPNQVPLGERVFHLVSAVVLLVYGSYGVWMNDLYVRGKYGKGFHLHDGMAWLMFGAFVSAVCVMLSVVVDHYDRRNNERKYRQFARTTMLIGWGFFSLSIGVRITGYSGGLKGLGVLVAVVSVSMALAVWMRYLSDKTHSENQALMAEWRTDEAKALAVTSGYPGAERFHRKARTMQYTEEPRYTESTLQALVIKRILRNSSGDYFFWMWRSDSPQYLKQITQVNAKVLLKQDYLAP